MRYMDRLQGSTRTNAPITRVATIDNRRAANRAAESMRRQDTDSRSFHEMRRMMHQTVGVCG